MAIVNTLKKVTGGALVSPGATIFTVPIDTTITIIGLRASNTDDTTDHEIEFTVAGQYVSGVATPLPIGSAIDVMDGSKIVAEAGDDIIAISDADGVVDVYVSYLEQVDDGA